MPVPLVIAEYNLKKVPAAMGLFMVTSGIMCLIVGPFIGKSCRSLRVGLFGRRTFIGKYLGLTFTSYVFGLGSFYL